MLNLYLNPLYSIRGDSTTLEEPLTKYDCDVTLRKNPLYRWNTFTQRILVLSETCTQDSLYNIYNYKVVLTQSCVV
jgi:hypothetical protein